MTPLQRLQDQLQRDQDRRNSRLNRDAELIREYRDEDEGKGVRWAIACGTVAGPASPGAGVSPVSAIRGPSTIARRGK